MSEAYPIASPPADWTDRRRKVRHVDPNASKLVVRPAARFTCAVVGVTFGHGYPDSVLSLRERIGDPKAVNLWRDHGNQYDSNAVAVVNDSGEILGHLPRNVAAKVAPLFDAGNAYLVTGWRVVAGWRGGEARPGLEVDVERAA